jgi:hypothetical protein
MMKGLLVAAAFAAAALFNVSAQAFPTSAQPAASAGGAAMQVAGGCGRGFHRGPYGRCVRNMSRAYPCWYVRGPYGHWHLVCR